jgi:hypothetical protein
MRSDTTPDEPFVAAFCQHHPQAADRDLQAAWERRVSGPAQAAVQTYYPALKEHHALEQVFRYTDLRQLVERLEDGSPITAPRSPDDDCGCGDPTEGGPAL